MIIQKLRLQHFKNHLTKDFEFSPQINCFVGNNGVGKTNVLDALHYISVGKSFLGNSDHQNIMEGEKFFTIDAEIDTGEKEDLIKIQFQTETKKVIRKNEKSYERLSDHFGYLPNVMISPYDSNLISDSGESRRKFLDAMISQTDSQYLFDLQQYQKTILQRNALLKYFAKNRNFDLDSLSIYDEPIIKFGTEIFEKRKKFTSELSPIIQHFYEIISGGKEEVKVSYQSQINDEKPEVRRQKSEAENQGFDHLSGEAYREYKVEISTNEIFKNLLEKNISKDRQLTYTSAGIHKDDLIFEMNGKLLKKIGSQGQQKSFLIALKLAQINRIKTLTGKNPILLLDDIFDKLDDSRVSKLIELINKENFGQMFITDTHRERTESVVRRIHEQAQIFEI